MVWSIDKNFIQIASVGPNFLYTFKLNMFYSEANGNFSSHFYSNKDASLKFSEISHYFMQNMSMWCKVLKLFSQYYACIVITLWKNRTSNSVMSERRSLLFWACSLLSPHITYYKVILFKTLLKYIYLCGGNKKIWIIIVDRN